MSKINKGHSIWSVNSKQDYLDSACQTLFAKYCLCFTLKMYNFIKKQKAESVRDLSNLLRYDSKIAFQIELTRLGYKEKTESYTYELP